MTSVAFFRHSTLCFACGEALIAPIQSQYESAEEVHHFWCCWNCGNEFETLDHVNAMANVATELVRKGLPVFVAE
jgi:uncharacterized protein with PIN domain